MSFDFLIKQREQRLRGILRVSPCGNTVPHNAEACTACCAVAAERFLVDAVEADFQRQVATGLEKPSPPAGRNVYEHRNHPSNPFPGTSRLAELHKRLSEFAPKDGPSTRTAIDYHNK